MSCAAGEPSLDGLAAAPHTHPSWGRRGERAMEPQPEVALPLPPSYPSRHGTRWRVRHENQREEDVLQAPALGVQRDSWLRACEAGATDILPPLLMSVLERQTREGRKRLQRTEIAASKYHEENGP